MFEVSLTMDFYIIQIKKNFKKKFKKILKISRYGYN